MHVHNIHYIFFFHAFPFFFTVFSKELVDLLQERHEVQEQIEMRRIAVEQLLQFHTEDLTEEMAQIRLDIMHGVALLK